MKSFLAKCPCGRTTSKAYLRKAGRCKECHTGEPQRIRNSRERDNASLIDSGYQAYARERGDYDLPDNW